MARLLATRSRSTEARADTQFDFAQLTWEMRATNKKTPTGIPRNIIGADIDMPPLSAITELSMVYRCQALSRLGYLATVTISAMRIRGPSQIRSSTSASQKESKRWTTQKRGPKKDTCPPSISPNIGGLSKPPPIPEAMFNSRFPKFLSIYFELFVVG